MEIIWIIFKIVFSFFFLIFLLFTLGSIAIIGIIIVFDTVMTFFAMLFGCINHGIPRIDIDEFPCPEEKQNKEK